MPGVFSGTRLSLLSGRGGGFDLVRDVFGNGLYAGTLLDFTSLTQIGGLAPLYTTNTGETPVTANGNTIGLALDRSQGAVIGSEARAGGTISTIGAPGTPATYNTATGEGTVSRDDASNNSGVLIPATVGKFYLVDIEKTGGAANINIRLTSINGASLLSSSVGSRATYLLLVTTGSGFYIASTSNSASASFTLHSVKPVAGYHGYQGTSGSRGTWSSDGYWLGDGSDDHLISGLLPGNDMTIIAAIYPTAASDVVAGTAASTDFRSLGIATNASGQLTLMLGASALSISAIKSSVDVRNEWSVATAIGSGVTGTLRRNGVLVASGDAGGALNTSVAYMVGAYSADGLAANRFAGRIARMLIVKRSNMSPSLLLSAERAIGSGFVSL